MQPKYFGWLKYNTNLLFLQLHFKIFFSFTFSFLSFFHKLLEHVVKLIVWHIFDKAEVTGSSPVISSSFYTKSLWLFFFLFWDFHPLCTRDPDNFIATREIWLRHIDKSRHQLQFKSLMGFFLFHPKKKPQSYQTENWSWIDASLNTSPFMSTGFFIFTFKKSI